MKKILIFILVLISMQGLSNEPPRWKVFKVGNVEYYQFTPPSNYTYLQVRYRWIAAMLDSGLHIPSYNGTPSGTRTGVWPWDGAIGMDTTNHRFYIFSGNAWVRVANYSEVGSTYTANLPIRITGTVVSADTSYAYNPSLTTNTRLQKIIDSLNAAGWASGGITSLAAIGSSPNANGATISGSTLNLQPADGSFGGVVTTGTQTFAGNKTFLGTWSGGGLVMSSSVAATSSTNQYLAGSTGGFQSKFTSDQGGITQFANYAYSAHAFIQDGAHTEAASGTHRLVSNLLLQPVTWNNGGATTTNAATLYIRGSTLGTASITNNYSMWIDSGLVRIDDIPYNSGSEIVALGQDTLTGVIYRKTASGGGGIQPSDTAAMLSNYLRGATKGYGIDISGSQHKTWAADSTSGGVTSWVRTKKIIDSLQAAGWGSNSVNYEPWYRYMLDITGGSNYGFTPTYSGTGSSQNRINPVPGAGWLGAIELNLGTSSTAYNIIQISNPSTYTGVHITSSYRFNFGAKIRFEDLSDVTETYHFIMGFTNNNYIETSVTEGVWVSYNYTDSSGAFVFKTRSGGSTTAVSTGVTVAADTDYEVEITIFGGTAYCYIKTGTGAKTLVGQSSTNIPTTTNMTFATRKSAGTTTRKTYLGWLGFGSRQN